MVYRHTRRRSERQTPHPTREHLIDVTVELIGEVGLENVDISEILHRAELTSGALYHHFRDLSGLLDAAVTRRFPVGVLENLEQIRVALDAATTLEEYQRLMRAVTEASQAPENRPRRKERAHYLALALSSDTLRETIAEQQREITDRFTEVLTEVQRRGWLRRDLDPRAVAVFVQAYTLGRIIDDVNPDPVAPDAWNDVVNTVMLDALSED